MVVVFLSHSAADKQLARRIAVELAMSSIQVWFDEWNILVGQSITQSIERGLEDAAFVVVLLTRASVQSGWVQKEWRSRIWDEAKTRDVHVLPVLCEDCDIPLLLRDKRYADVRTDFVFGLRWLVGSIRSLTADTRPVMAGARIETGSVTIERVTPPLPLIVGLISVIQRGCFERFEGGLRAHIHMAPPHAAMRELGERMGTDRMVLETRDFSISTDAAKPTRFTSKQAFTIPAGDSVTDLVSGRRLRLPAPLVGSAHTEVAAHVVGGELRGVFAQDLSMAVGATQRFAIIGKFQATIAL